MKNENPAQNLCAAILLQAIADSVALKKGTIHQTPDVNAEELDEFFASSWFEELCDSCDIDKNFVLKKLNKTCL